VQATSEPSGAVAIVDGVDNAASEANLNGRADIEQEKLLSIITLSTSPDPCHRLDRLTDPDLLRNLVPHKNRPDGEPVRQRFRHRHDIGPAIFYQRTGRQEKCFRQSKVPDCGLDEKSFVGSTRRRHPGLTELQPGNRCAPTSSPSDKDRTVEFVKRVEIMTDDRCKSR
jgi:hypothetical protein